jgi:basic membrane protein A
MVLDVGGIGDKGFNDAGWAGVQRAVKELGVKGDLIQSHEQADFVQNLSLAAQNAEVVVAMGFLMADAVRQAAPLHPETRFVFVDGAVEAPNVASYDFKAQEGAYLAGLLSAAATKTGTVGAVLGMEIPPVKAYEAGFRAGVLTFNRRRGRGVRYVAATAGGFDNPVKGKSLARALMGKGADVLIQIAGNTGVGVIEAVKEAPEGTYAVGADIDQDDLAPGRVLVSVLKRIDNAVFEAIRAAKEGGFEAGHRWIGIAEGASGLTEMRHTRQAVPPEALEMARRAEAMIREGRLIVPSRIEALETFVPPEL